MHRKYATHKQFSCLKHKQPVNMNQDTFLKKKKNGGKKIGNVIREMVMCWYCQPWIATFLKWKAERIIRCRNY